MQNAKFKLIVDVSLLDVNFKIMKWDKVSSRAFAKGDELLCIMNQMGWRL